MGVINKQLNCFFIKETIPVSLGKTFKNINRWLLRIIKENIIITHPLKSTSIKLQTRQYMVNEHISSLFFHSGKQIKELGRENDERDFPEDYKSPTLTFLITFSPAIALAALNITNTLEYKLLCFKPYF